MQLLPLEGRFKLARERQSLEDAFAREWPAPRRAGDPIPVQVKPELCDKTGLGQPSGWSAFFKDALRGLECRISLGLGDNIQIHNLTKERKTVTLQHGPNRFRIALGPDQYKDLTGQGDHQWNLDVV
jgi:hypothetical protein